MAFYVYELALLNNGQVFYVGKGSGNRVDHHRYVLSRPHLKEYQKNAYKRMRAVLKGHEFEERIVYITDNEILALLKEHALILHYGFENLTNVQSHAFTGRKMKPEVGQIIAERLRQYVRRCREQYGKGHPPEVAAKISAANAGKIKAPGHGLKVWKSRCQNPNFPQDMERLKAHCRQLAEANIGQKQTPEHIEKCAAAHRGLKRTPEQLIRQSRGKLLGRRGGPSAKSQYRGVSWKKSENRWESRIMLLKKSTSLGRFKLEIDAAWAYDNVAEKHLGLRPNSTPQNHQIAPSETHSEYRGVSLYKRSGYWNANIMKRGKHHFLGQFKSEVEAARAYDNAAEELFNKRPNNTLRKIQAI